MVSIPSRGFWFFEEVVEFNGEEIGVWFQSPRGDFGFLKTYEFTGEEIGILKFQSPRGDFGFLKLSSSSRSTTKSFRTQFGFNPLAGILVF